MCPLPTLVSDRNRTLSWNSERPGVECGVDLRLGVSDLTRVRRQPPLRRQPEHRPTLRVLPGAGERTCALLEDEDEMAVDQRERALGQRDDPPRGGPDALELLHRAASEREHEPIGLTRHRELVRTIGARGEWRRRRGIDDEPDFGQQTNLPALDRERAGVRL